MNLDIVSAGSPEFIQKEQNSAIGVEVPAPWQVEIAERAQIQSAERWVQAFAGSRKDWRYYALVEDTIHPEFEYRYFVLKDGTGQIRAVQPFFIIDQDLLTGSGPRVQSTAAGLRRFSPRLLKMRTLMVGCAAGEGYLDAHEEQSRLSIARSLAGAIERHARTLKAKLVVFKEFKAADRSALECLGARGFARIPSMPMTRLRLNFKSFDEYMRNVLSSRTRSRLRRGFRETAKRANLEFRVLTDITPYIDETYPLYLAVFGRSPLQFEKITPEYFCNIGRAMSDRALFFLIFKDGKPVAFNLCLLKDSEICSEYVGYDYECAFDLHLYNEMVRFIIDWALESGYEWFCSTSLNYEPKYHFRHELDPLDLYVKHTTPPVNFILKRALRYLEPTSRDPMLPRFSNYADLHGT
jgi:Acetyltransferase (GNAT) domain